MKQKNYDRKIKNIIRPNIFKISFLWKWRQRMKGWIIRNVQPSVHRQILSSMKHKGFKDFACLATRQNIFTLSKREEIVRLRKFSKSRIWFHHSSNFLKDLKLTRLGPEFWSPCGWELSDRKPLDLKVRNS